MAENEKRDLQPGAADQAAEEVPEIRELRDVPVEEVPTDLLPDIAREVKEHEPEAVREVRREIEDALDKPIEAIEDAANRLDEETTPSGGLFATAHTESKTVVFGRELPYPIYTVVFGALAVITAVEIAIAELLSRDFFLTIPALLVLSTAKVVLVVLYYMHLKDDNRIYAIALVLPVFIATIATLFLTAVPLD